MNQHCFSIISIHPSISFKHHIFNIIHFTINFSRLQPGKKFYVDIRDRQGKYFFFHKKWPGTGKPKKFIGRPLIGIGCLLNFKGPPGTGEKPAPGGQRLLLIWMTGDGACKCANGGNPFHNSTHQYPGGKRERQKNKRVFKFQILKLETMNRTDSFSTVIRTS